MDVSVIIPVLNGEAFVDQAIGSALLPGVREVLVVDDGSTDGTIARCRAWADRDPRVRVLQHPGGAHRGVSASRNLGIEASVGSFVAFLDADDRYLPVRFEEDERVLARHPDAHGVYHAIGVHALDEEGLADYDRMFGRALTGMRSALAPEDLFPALSGMAGAVDPGHIHLDGLTVRRDVLVRKGLRFDEQLAYHEDTDLILRLAHGSRLYPGVLDRPVATRGVHLGNRLTHHRDFAATRQKAYAALVRWAIREGVDRRALRRFRSERDHHAVLLARNSGQSMHLLGLFLSAPHLWRRPDTPEVVLAGLLGGEGRLYRGATSLLRGLRSGVRRVLGRRVPLRVRTVDDAGSQR